MSARAGLLGSMTTTRPAPAHGPLHGALELLERATSYTRVQLQVVSPPMLARPTPCARWTLAELLGHMGESLDALADGAGLGTRDEVAVRSRGVGVLESPDGPTSSVAVVDQLRERACTLLGAWSSVAHVEQVSDTDLALRSSALASAGALEVAVHGWDVSQATSTCEPIPAVLARDLLPWADLVITRDERPGRFDPPVAGPSVGPSSRLLRMLGREP